MKIAKESYKCLASTSGAVDTIIVLISYIQGIKNSHRWHNVKITKEGCKSGASWNGTLVEKLTHNPTVKGSILATGDAGRERKW
jgi:hypothetical protein